MQETKLSFTEMFQFESELKAINKILGIVSKTPAQEAIANLDSNKLQEVVEHE